MRVFTRRHRRVFCVVSSRSCRRNADHRRRTSVRSCADGPPRIPRRNHSMPPRSRRNGDACNFRSSQSSMGHTHSPTAYLFVTFCRALTKYCGGVFLPWRRRHSVVFQSFHCNRCSNRLVILETVHVSLFCCKKSARKDWVSSFSEPRFHCHCAAGSPKA